MEVGQPPHKDVSVTRGLYANQSVQSGSDEMVFSFFVRIFLLLVVLVSFVMWRNVEQAHCRDGFGMPGCESTETRAVERIPYLEGGPIGRHHQRQIVQPP